MARVHFKQQSSRLIARRQAHQRAQLIRIAQDDNFWLENIRSFEDCSLLDDARGCI